MYEPPSARMGVGKRQGEGGDCTLPSPRQISILSQECGCGPQSPPQPPDGRTRSVPICQAGQRHGESMQARMWFPCPTSGARQSILFRPRSCEGGRLTDTPTAVDGRILWRASGQAGLGWLEFLPGLPAREALPRQDIPRWEGVCKCVLTTLATNVRASVHDGNGLSDGSRQ